MLEILNTLAQGGPVMVPLAVCSLLAATVIIERYLALRKADRGGEELIATIRRAYRSGDGAEGLSRCEQIGGPVANVLAAGLRAHLLEVPTAEAMEERALADQRMLNRRLVVLDTIVTLAPLLGLLGTVLGMIRAFGIISVSGTSHPAGITGGVAEALIATATGLGIAIITLIGYNWCRDKVRQVTEEIELRATQLENLLAGAPGTDQEKQAEREEASVAH
ncbi:MAG: MotA/TolQ/ExbB proton channel family protein [Armatimonadota bacterium]|nr:MAG: MotA/TolQ/ExbB proton channel family protein [Armatimonadota bacterium]